MQNHEHVIYSLPQAPFRKTDVNTNHAKYDKFPQKHEKSLKHIIYYLPQAPFRQENVQQIMKI